MSKFKQAVMALAAASLLSAHAHASDVPAQSVQMQSSFAPVVFSQADIQGMFEQGSKPMQLAALSPQEMKETEGAWWFIYYWGPAILSGSVWLANSGWRTIPSVWHRVRQW